MDSFNQKLTRKYKEKRVGTGSCVPAVNTRGLLYVWLSAVLQSRPQPHASHYNGSFRTETLCELFRESYVCVRNILVCIYIYIYTFLIFLPQNVKSRKNVLGQICRTNVMIIIINIMRTPTVVHVKMFRRCFRL